MFGVPGGPTTASLRARASKPKGNGGTSPRPLGPAFARPSEVGPVVSRVPPRVLLEAAAGCA
eukprot:9776843-Lingulodinium_polyedra.AAC.1